MARLDPAISAMLAALAHLAKNRRMREAWVYMVTNRRDGVIYTGVTGYLARRAWKHRDGIVPGFTRKYHLKRLVWVERHATILSAIQRQKKFSIGRALGRWR